MASLNRPGQPKSGFLQSVEARRNARRWVRAEQSVIVILLVAATFVSVLTTIGIIVTLIKESFGFFQDVSVWEFITGTKWAPLFEPQSFGVLPLIGGTLLAAGIAGIVALTLGLGAAIYLSEYAPDRVRRIIKPILEVLAGIPTVVYGFFALSFVTPLLQSFLPIPVIFNVLSAGIVMGLMIMPMVSTLSEDAMVAVPRPLRDAAYALGATRFEVAVKVVVPAALPGIVASFILALSRAIGETLIVTIAAGATPNLTLNPLESIQTMTAYIVQVSLGETPQGTLVFKTIFAVGLVLFLMTLAMNIAGRWIVRRYTERY
ncbi:MAG: phosphate ABC transporter permease subunit PstC [Chloroflexi bacterium]|jgi:phosphate transport system permease protein|nr:phosphate ABC transporter permease subunit PstC [Chloroflexota bacterium]MBT4074268.1 phosphate ABC transporter permease subunit PstC [Chloroflexota bacterium]MBT4515631.1 phosphate ABC transporter permease subunit PstC [Chloroflexota bacterium]MBT5320440.1 phosphate ABC transporter permease subunit PstC [Chloroflexota bacterium]MBT6683018.1 phosphate ABC transporter permease subunit PstC [Chloroflexota bacterium]